MANPIQIVLNADHYQTARDVPSGGGRAKEFYPNADADFVKHRDALRDQAASIAGSLRAQSSSPLGHLKVKLRRGGWAKSHRPCS